MGEAAVREALLDAWIPYHRVQQAFAGYVHGDSVSGQAVLHRVGMSGIPIVNVNNDSASGSSALWLACQAVASGAADCVLAVGFDEMRPGSSGSLWSERPDAPGRFEAAVRGLQGYDAQTSVTAQCFGGAALSYMDKYGARPETFAKVAVKARRHAASNPNAVFREPVSEEAVLASPHVSGPLTRLQCCPPACGAAAAVLCSESFAHRHGMDGRVVVRAQALVTEGSSTFAGQDMMTLVGYDMAKAAAHQVYEAAGVGPEDVGVAELHDCFTANELITYESLGLTPEGTAEKFILDGDNTYGGRVVTNPSGGLLSKGHPPGASGLAQCAELVWQLRERAGVRQVEGARLALQHSLARGGACMITLYERLR
jgi:acetyl-CoA acetyltransferase